MWLPARVKKRAKKKEPMSSHRIIVLLETKRNKTSTNTNNSDFGTLHNISFRFVSIHKNLPEAIKKIEQVTTQNLCTAVFFNNLINEEIDDGWMNQ